MVTTLPLLLFYLPEYLFNFFFSFWNRLIASCLTKAIGSKNSPSFAKKFAGCSYYRKNFLFKQVLHILYNKVELRVITL